MGQIRGAIPIKKALQETRMMNFLHYQIRIVHLLRPIIVGMVANQLRDRIMPTYSVETLTANSRRQAWTTPNVIVAEALARKLSVVAVNDPAYPNPFLVVESDNTLCCQYLAGDRQASFG